MLNPNGNTTEIPEFLYKYQSLPEIFEGKELPYSLKALFGGYCVFSDPNKFNDPFDGKNHYFFPNKKEVNEIMYSGRFPFTKKLHKQFKELVRLQKKNDKREILSYQSRLYQECFNLSSSVERNSHVKLYCLSKLNNHNLLWSHYASSHYGYCLEFIPEKFSFDVNFSLNKMYYEDNIPHVNNLLNYLSAVYAKEVYIDNKKYYTVFPEVKEPMEKSVQMKLKYWEYEQEYRYFIGDNYASLDYKPEFKSLFNKVDLGTGLLSYHFPPKALNSIIFGYRTHKDLKQLIKSKMRENPDFRHVKFRDAKICTASSSIIFENHKK